MELSRDHAVDVGSPLACPPSCPSKLAERSRKPWRRRIGGPSPRRIMARRQAHRKHARCLEPACGVADPEPVEREPVESVENGAGPTHRSVSANVTRSIVPNSFRLSRIARGKAGSVSTAHRSGNAALGRGTHQPPSAAHKRAIAIHIDKPTGQPSKRPSTPAGPSKSIPPVR